MLGDEIHGFQLESIDVLEDYHGYGYLFRHRISKMEVYHVANDDSENFFAFIFKTPPVDDCGTPHIIEHSVLAGSKRYPIKDPFMSLLKGSVNTFMNAMTYPDYTIYLAASPLEADYQNLFQLYSDAVFNPLLREETFWQEGIRLVQHENGEYSFDGVVFNEMLGDLSNHDSLVGRASVRSLFPDTPYYYESGGDPSSIVNLHYQQFLGYYTTHYHPSNCRLFLYGSQQVEQQLELLDRLYIGDAVAMTPRGPSALAKSWTKPKVIHTHSLSEEGSEHETSSVTINWATTQVENSLEVTTLSILTDILLGNPGSPLYKAIIESGLAEDISQISGMDTTFRQMTFSVGFKGIDPNRSEEALQVVIDELRRLVEQGIPRTMVLNALKRQEFQAQELTGDLPIGFRAMTRALRGWLQGSQPHSTIGFTQDVKTLRTLVEQSMVQEGELFSQQGGKGYFEQWIQTHLLDNPHRSVVVVTPSLSYNEQLEKAIAQRLNHLTQEVSDEQLESIRKQNAQFHQFEEKQESEEDLATIPQLHREDLPTEIRILDQQLKNVEGVSLYLQPMESNGIIYLDGFFTLDHLTQKEMMLIPLLARLLTMTHVGDSSYDEVALRMREVTGGLFFFVENSRVIGQESDSFTALGVRIKTLERDFEQGVLLLKDLLFDAVVVDPQRIKAVLLDQISNYSSSILDAGHMFASQRAASHFSATLHQSELWGGIAQWNFLKGIDLSDEHSLKEVGDSLLKIYTHLFRKENTVLHLCASEQLLSESEEYVHTFITSLDEHTLQKNPTQHLAEVKHLTEVFTAPSSVSYNALVCRSAAPLDPLQAHQGVLAALLTTNHLWSAIRGKGGAYGASSSVDMLEQVCTFASYRDPRIEATLDDFVSVLEIVAQQGVDEKALEATIVRIIGREIRPLFPNNASLLAFRRSLYGIDDQMRLQRRTWVLETSVEDIKKAAQSLIDSIQHSSSVAVITAQTTLHKQEPGGRLKEVVPTKLPL